MTKETKMIEKIQKQIDNINEEIEVLEKNLKRLRSKKEKLDDKKYLLLCEEKRKKYLDKYLGKLIHIYKKSNDIEIHILGKVKDHDGKDYFFLEEKAIEYVLKDIRLEYIGIKDVVSIAEYYEYNKNSYVEIIEDYEVVSILEKLFIQRANELKETKRKIKEFIDLLKKNN